MKTHRSNTNLFLGRCLLNPWWYRHSSPPTLHPACCGFGRGTIAAIRRLKAKVRFGVRCVIQFNNMYGRAARADDYCRWGRGKVACRRAHASCSQFCVQHCQLPTSGKLSAYWPCLWPGFLWPLRSLPVTHGNQPADPWLPEIKFHQNPLNGFTWKYNKHLFIFTNFRDYTSCTKDDEILHCN